MLSVRFKGLDVMDIPLAGGGRPGSKRGTSNVGGEGPSWTGGVVSSGDSLPTWSIAAGLTLRVSRFATRPLVGTGDSGRALPRSLDCASGRRADAPGEVCERDALRIE